MVKIYNLKSLVIYWQDFFFSAWNLKIFCINSEHQKHSTSSQKKPYCISALTLQSYVVCIDAVRLQLPQVKVTLGLSAFPLHFYNFYASLEPIEHLKSNENKWILSNNYKISLMCLTNQPTARKNRFLVSTRFIQNDE